MNLLFFLFCKRRLRERLDGDTTLWDIRTSLAAWRSFCGDHKATVEHILDSQIGFDTKHRCACLVLLTLSSWIAISTVRQASVRRSLPSDSKLKHVAAISIEGRCCQALFCVLFFLCLELSLKVSAGHHCCRSLAHATILGSARILFLNTLFLTSWNNT